MSPNSKINTKCHQRFKKKVNKGANVVFFKNKIKIKIISDFI